MALLKQVEFNATGVELTYHKIQSVNLDYANGLVDVYFMSYSSEGARLGGKAPIQFTEYLSFPVDLTQPLIPQIYGFAKTNEASKLFNASDC